LPSFFSRSWIFAFRISPVGEAAAPAGFGAPHLPAVGFVIHAQQVEETVQHQDADFVFERVAEGGGLRAGAGGGDRDFAERALEARPGGLSHGERKDVGGIVLAQEVAVQAAECGIAGDKTGETGTLSDFAAQSSGEAFQVAAVQFRRRPAEQNYVVV